MKYEPAIDRLRLIEAVRSSYGLVVEEISFVPVGYVAAAYAVQCADRAHYFLKLWPDTRAGRDGAARLSSYLPLTGALVERGLYPRVPYPIPARDGRLWSSFDGVPFVLFPHLAGFTPPSWPDWPLPIWEELARAVAAIHCATPGLTDVLPPRESFAFVAEADLRRGLAHLERIGLGARLGVCALQAAVLPRLDEIHAQIDRLNRLRQVVLQIPDAFVLCHTDMGGENLLVDDVGQIVVLDWEGATVAPPEHDLQCAVEGRHLRCFIEVYRQSGGAPRLHLDHFAFYLQRRYLDDMAARLLRILEEDTTADEDAELLAGMETWGFEQWRRLDQTLEGIASALEE
jgi:Ser/Thr protein kinase RdoA (MazF antagonist)